MKAAREERDKALKASWDAVELVEKNKMEFEKQKEEWNNNFKEENIKVKEVDFDKYRSTGVSKQSNGVGDTNHQPSSARPM